MVGQPGQQDPTAQLLNLIKSATPEDLQSNQLSEQLAGLIGGGQNKGQQGTGLVNQAMKLSFSALVGTALQKVDFSKLGFLAQPLEKVYFRSADRLS